MQKRVSVVVTCYNHEEYIEECLQSIFDQTYPNIELYVYNDGSTDQSGKLIQESLKQSPFLKTNYIDQDNRGLVFTRNQALKVIEGDYFLFVDSDNFLETNYVEVLVQAAEREGADIVYTKLIDPETGHVVLEPRNFDLQAFYIENFIDSCSLVRRAKAEGLFYDPWLNYKKLEDYDFFFQLIVDREAIAFPVKKGTHLNYRVLENSMSARNNYRKYYQAYAHILGKYYQANPVFAEIALRKNFARFGKLVDLEALYENEVISIYRNQGEGFHETKKETLKLEMEGHFQIEFSKEDQELRLDFSELPIYLSLLQIETNGLNIEVSGSNGVKVSHGWVFPNTDPQLVINTFGQNGSVQINYRRMVLGNVYSEEFAAHILSNEIQLLQATVQSLGQSLDKSERQYAELKKSYDAIVNSRRWIWLNRMLSIFRRKK